MTTVHVGVIPIATEAPFYLAQSKGYFAQHGLNVVVSPVENGPAGTAALTSGEAQFGEQSIVPAITAISKGLPIAAIAGDENVLPPKNPTQPYPDIVVLTKKTSNIDTPAELNGKTVAVNALRAGAELVVRAALDNAGGNASTLKLLPVPFPDMLTALSEGRVDAIAEIEPFVTACLAGNCKVLFNTYPYGIGNTTNFVASVWLTSRSYANQHPAVVKAFREALQEADSYLEGHPEQIPVVVSRFTKIPLAVSKKIALPTWATVLNRKSYDLTVGLMVKYGFISKRLPFSKFALSSAPSQNG